MDLESVVKSTKKQLSPFKVPDSTVEYSSIHLSQFEQPPKSTSTPNKGLFSSTPSNSSSTFNISSPLANKNKNKLLIKSSTPKSVRIKNTVEIINHKKPPKKTKNYKDFKKQCGNEKDPLDIILHH